MTIKADTFDEYLSQVPEERKEAIARLRQVLKDNLPVGFEEGIGNNMPGFDVPHTLYPAGYHCDPKQPLPFVGFASQNNFIAFYHMGVYAIPEIYEWFISEYPKHSKTKLDMGKSCIRFKKPEQIPFDLIAQLAQKITPQQWIEIYEANLKPKK
jgi:uncharacterized protein YdhG (YjbR/CyaY superfamily)